MGDYADMVLEGVIDEFTGEYVGDHNLEKYGVEAPGFPVSLEREAEEKAALKAQNIARNAAKKKVKCRICGKKVKAVGLADHQRDAHNA
jgi:hypothetical protein